MRLFALAAAALMDDRRPRPLPSPPIIMATAIRTAGTATAIAIAASRTAIAAAGKLSTGRRLGQRPSGVHASSSVSGAKIVSIM